MTISFVTSTYARNLDADLPILVSAARERGIDADITIWDDPTVDWSSYDAVIVRSCWDYIVRHRDFLAWAATIPSLHNSHEVLAWNTDKVYLRQLEAAGVPIIETRWNVGPTDELGDHAEWVVKPTISAGSRDTARWATSEEVRAHSAELIGAGRMSMTQPYIASVDEEGETAMMYFGGEFSHAIRKGPLLLPGEGVRQDRDSRESITPREPTAAQSAVAAAALDAAVKILELDLPPLYARVDLVTEPSGEPVLIELELAEPSLFLPESDGGAERLMGALAQRME